MDLGHERITIKQLLFSKAIPNHVIPVPTAGYKIYACIDCGDKYLFQSSYEYHVNRKSMEITYTCRFCNYITHTFFNRCNLLAHIRNHAFKTATINLSDLKVQPLPLEYFNIDSSVINSIHEIPGETGSVVDTNQNSNDDGGPEDKTELTNKESRCHECNEVIGNNYRHRAKHFMGSTKIYTCPLCLFVLPTLCAFKAHIRIHVRSPPYFCPECGVILRAKALYYPYNHDCEGFKMMRVNARLKCLLPNCYLYHPSEHKRHMESCHIKQVYKCSLCVVASFSKSVMDKHVATHDAGCMRLVFYQCELCPGRLVMEHQYKNHIKGHMTNHVYPCRSCSLIFKEIPTLLQHYSNKHANKHMGELLLAILKDSEELYYIIKRCEKCKRSFRYKCKYSEINKLPTDCPYNCFRSDDEDSTVIPTINAVTDKHSNIICHLCKCSIPDDWSKIKAHYAAEHKSFKCLDLKLNIPRSNVSASSKLKLKRVQRPSTKLQKRLRKRMRRNLQKNESPKAVFADNEATKIRDPNKHMCKICEEEFDGKAILQEHLLTHRDPYMAYQCMECGKCFVVKPSFSTHLLLEHEISNPDTYIEEKNCYNKDALIKNEFNTPTTNEAIRENQCNICKDQFDNPDDLEKHYRVHGMAFLIKNKSKSP